MKLVAQWRTLEASLPQGWATVRLNLTTEQPGDLGRAAQMLGPINAGRVGSAVVFDVSRAAGPHGPQRAERLFERLDAERTWCTLAVAAVTETAPAPEAVEPSDAAPATSVVASWETALAELPSGWSDLLCELEIESSTLLDRTALLCGPVNPTRAGSRPAFTFRCSSGEGYGVSSAMARRCFERLDEEGIAGRAHVLRVLSETDNVYTQGPVWLVGGKTL